MAATKTTSQKTRVDLDYAEDNAVKADVWPGWIRALIIIGLSGILWTGIALLFWI